MTMNLKAHIRHLLICFIMILNATPGHAESEEKSASLEQQLRDARQHLEITNRYVHDWIRFPEFSGQDILRNRQTLIRPRYGRTTVVVFLASWCLPCQRLAPTMRALHEKHHPRFTDFVFVYTGDTERDAMGFVKEYGLPGTNLLANPSIILEFRNPEPPAIFIADRHGWLVDIIFQLDEKKLADLDQFLSLMALK